MAEDDTARDSSPLTDSERAELEQLRAERAARAEAAERAELKKLRAERERVRIQQEQDKHIQELRERNRKLMEPDDEDLSMPVAQRVVLGVLAFIVLAFVVYLVTGNL